LRRHDNVQRGAEAALKSEWDAFEEAKECLNDDLTQVLIAQEDA